MKKKQGDMHLDLFFECQKCAATQKKKGPAFTRGLGTTGAMYRDRTGDTRNHNPMLYQLS